MTRRMQVAISPDKSWQQEIHVPERYLNLKRASSLDTPWIKVTRLQGYENKASVK